MLRAALRLILVEGEVRRRHPVPARLSYAALRDGIRTENALCRYFSGAGRDRTDDLMLAKHALSQLSYSPM
jgi:hypothetical protein